MSEHPTNPKTHGGSRPGAGRPKGHLVQHACQGAPAEG